jgi:hypothetical protein
MAAIAIIVGLLGVIAGSQEPNCCAPSSLLRR